MIDNLVQLADDYRRAGDSIHDAIRDLILKEDGFINCSNNRFDRPDILAQVYDKKKGYTESFPIRAMRVSTKGEVEVYVGTAGTIYTDKYLRGKQSEERWMPLRGSNILFYQTILSIAGKIDEYLPGKPEA